MCIARRCGPTGVVTCAVKLSATRACKRWVFQMEQCNGVHSRSYAIFTLYQHNRNTYLTRQVRQWRVRRRFGDTHTHIHARQNAVRAVMVVLRRCTPPNQHNTISILFVHSGPCVHTDQETHKRVAESYLRVFSHSIKPTRCRRCRRRRRRRLLQFIFVPQDLRCPTLLLSHPKNRHRFRTVPQTHSRTRTHMLK